MKKLEYAFKIFDNLQSLIKFIDQKASAILIVAGLIANIYFFIFNNLVLIQKSSLNIKNCFIFLLSLLVFIFTLIVFYLLLFKVFFPRKAKKSSSTKSMTFYFEHISQKDETNFLDDFSSLNEKQMEEEVLKQIYELSFILSEKIKYLKYVLRVLFLDIILLSILIILIKV